MHHLRRGQRAQAQLGRHPRAPPVHQAGDLLRLPGARLQLEGRRPALRGLHQDEDVQLDAEVAAEGALGHLDLALEGGEEGAKGQGPGVLVEEGVEGAVHLLGGVEEADGARADGAAGGRRGDAWKGWEVKNYDLPKKFQNLC